MFNRRNSLLVFTGVLLGLLLPLQAGVIVEKKKPVPPPPAITKLLWLAGSWRGEKNSRLSDEQWMVPAGGVMLGMRRAVQKGKPVDYDFIQIREGPGGALFYVLQPSGQKEAAFQVSSMTETTIVFENQLQDYPRKISYSLQSDGSLLTSVEGVGSDGEEKRWENLFQRMNQ